MKDKRIQDFIEEFDLVEVDNEDNAEDYKPHPLVVAAYLFLLAGCLIQLFLV